MAADIGERMLKKLDSRVLLVDSGRKAIQLFEKAHHRIDIAMQDMVMPDMGGEARHLTS